MTHLGLFVEVYFLVSGSLNSINIFTQIFDVANITESERFNSCSFFLDGSHAHDPVANPRGGDDDVVKVFNDLKQGLGVTTGGIEKIAEGGYGLLKKAFSDEEEAPPKKDRAKMITDTLQNAIGAISDVVKVVQADGSMSYSQLAETAGEMLTSIGAMLGPVAGPVGPGKSTSSPDCAIL